MTFANDNDPNMAINGFGLLDLSAGIRTADRKYEFTIWGKNVFNKDYATYIFGQLGGAGNYSQYLGDPARYGLSAAVRF